jgi:intracellular sulfur oxidation DsrE/DsrF family protein
MNVRVLPGLGLLIAASVALFAAGAAPAPADPEQHRVVFQVTADGEEQWEAVVGNVENLRAALGPAKTRVQVVAHGKGLGMLVAATNANLRERMQKLHDGGVVFAACENTMRKKKVTKDALFPFATTVDSGVAEVVRKQEAGWAYVKSGL